MGLIWLLIGIVVFLVAIGFWMGWYVRGAYPGKKWEQALAMALFHSTLTIRSKPMVDILGRELVERLEARAVKQLKERNDDG
jgi:hypothetical protein